MEIDQDLSPNGHPEARDLGRLVSYIHGILCPSRAQAMYSGQST
jgi:hypothetical protein